MSDSYWRGPLTFVIFGAILAAISAILIWDSSAILTEQRVRYQEATRTYAEQAADRIERNCGSDLPATLMRDCVREEIEAADDRKRAERDLEAQEAMARFTRLMGYTGLIGLLVGVGSVYLIWATLKATQQMARDTRDIGEAQVRAYPTFKIIDIELREFEGMEKNLSATFNLKLGNSGQTPAKNITLLYGIGLCANREFKKLGDILDLTESAPVAAFIPAGATFDDGHGQSLKRTFKADTGKLAKGDLYLALFVMIRYDDVFGKRNETDPFFGMLDYREAQSGRPRMMYAAMRVDQKSKS